MLLFGPKREERKKCRAELEKLMHDLETVAKATDSPHESHDQKLVWFKKRLDILRQDDLHPVARIASSEVFHDMVLDYVRKLKAAVHGNKEAHEETKDIRQKCKTVLADERSRIEEHIQQLESVLSQTVKWQQRKAQALEDYDISLQRFDMLKPKDTNDWHEWKTYYTGRVKVLENPAIDVAARMLWTSHEQREALIKKYYELLNKLIGGEEVEQEFHEIEAHMEAIVDQESRRIRDKYSEFFEVEGL